jgi:hypothetical protein
VLFRSPQNPKTPSSFITNKRISQRIFIVLLHFFVISFLQRGPSIILLRSFDYFFEGWNLFLVPWRTPVGLAPDSWRLIPIDVIRIFDQRFAQKEQNEHALRPFAYI